MLILGAFAALLAAENPSASELMRQAYAAFQAGEGDQSLKLADRAVAAEPHEPRWLNGRGMLRFRLGRIRPSIEDFDRAIMLDPESEPHHWQRGISYYYAGEYEEGARQFEIHRTVNPHDVENAVWHYLCMARWKNITEAEASLIPIAGDRRVPMMEVHALFAGKATPENVLEAARAGEPSDEELHQRLFYAHLYLGLYHEAHGRADESLKHIRLAAEKYAEPHYMGDVARVHLNLRKPK